MKIRRGMTLIELMVGIVVTGVATAAGYAAFSSIIDNRERARESTMEVQRAASMRALLASWLSNATIVRDTGLAFPAASTIGASEPDDYLTFVTWGPTPLGSQQTQIRMYIDRDSFTPEEGLVAELTALNQPVDSNLMIVVSRKMELDPNVMGLEVSMLDPSTRLWMKQIDMGNVQPIGLLVQLYPAYNGYLHQLLQMPFVYPVGTSR